MAGPGLSATFYRLLRVGLICLPCAGVAAEPAATIAPPTPIAPPPLAPITSSLPMTNLVFDAELKEFYAKTGDPEGKFTFQMTNVSDVPVHILSINSSCGCTRALMPQTPWIIAPHSKEELHAVMQLAGKPVGETIKYLTIVSTNGTKQLAVKSIIPAPTAVAMTDRQRNQDLARADRQAVFKNDCAQCHVTPAAGKTGKELYDKACGICHDSEHRASLVPDLASLNHPVDAAFWKTMVADGKPNTLMPAFALEQGGPLTKEQVDSLVAYFMTEFPRDHKPTPQISVPAVPAPAPFRPPRVGVRPSMPPMAPSPVAPVRRPVAPPADPYIQK